MFLASLVVTSRLMLQVEENWRRSKRRWISASLAVKYLVKVRINGKRRVSTR